MDETTEPVQEVSFEVSEKPYEDKLIEVKEMKVVDSFTINELSEQVKRIDEHILNIEVASAKEIEELQVEKQMYSDKIKQYAEVV